MTSTRIVSPDTDTTVEPEATIRPRRMSEFVGQAAARKNLEVFIEAARMRGKPLDHVLFAGPPGLGKTTLSQIVAEEMGGGFKATSGPAIERAGDLAAILTGLEDGDVLFIDEIHRLDTAIEEILYPAMEDFLIDLIIGEGPTARSVRIELARFTLIGATTRAGMLSKPLHDRFGIPIRLQFYTEDELLSIVQRGAGIMKTPITEDGAREIARRSRGTPRIAGRLLRRVSDFAEVAGRPVDKDTASDALTRLEVDHRGLDALDLKYLNMIARSFGGGPVGVETLSAAIAEPRDAIEDVIEPYLIQQGFVQRTSRGRCLTADAYDHIGLTPPKTALAAQRTLFAELQ